MAGFSRPLLREAITQSEYPRDQSDCLAFFIA